MDASEEKFFAGRTRCPLMQRVRTISPPRPKKQKAALRPKILELKDVFAPWGRCAEPGRLLRPKPHCNSRQLPVRSGKRYSGNRPFRGSRRREKGDEHRIRNAHRGRFPALIITFSAVWMVLCYVQERDILMIGSE